MADNNVADMFCPHCCFRMLRVDGKESGINRSLHPPDGPAVVFHGRAIVGIEKPA
jgi:hypothetical protein